MSYPVVNLPVATNSNVVNPTTITNNTFNANVQNNIFNLLMPSNTPSKPWDEHNHGSHSWHDGNDGCSSNPFQHGGFHPGHQNMPMLNQFFRNPNWGNWNRQNSFGNQNNSAGWQNKIQNLLKALVLVALIKKLQNRFCN